MDTQGLRVSHHVRMTGTSDGAVLLDIRQGLCFSINPVGRLIWERLREGCEPDELVQYLANTFGICPDQAEKDAEDFLRQLIEKQLVERTGIAEQVRTSARVAEIWARLVKAFRINRAKALE